MNGWLGGISRKGRLRSFATLTQRGCCFPGASREGGSGAENRKTKDENNFAILCTFTQKEAKCCSCAWSGVRGLEICGEQKKPTIFRWWVSS